MNPAEIRIGNYVYYAGILCKVEELTIGGYLQTDGITAPLSAFNPVEITEEWILKFGFEHKAIIYIKGMVLRLVDKCLVGGFEDNEYGIEHEVKINYVHQLQNLFYALTSEELKLQIPE
ncbi:hypothetical protein [Elizabethkingia anophelis]|uniref:hypothetical protein n=1 Tax=Elizabethkingia anophelis TaxID=1117645 RepID=UPI003461AFC1